MSTGGVKVSQEPGYTVKGDVGRGPSTPASGISLLREDQDGQALAQAQTSWAGAYRFTNVPPGSYTLRIGKVRHKVTVTSDQRINIDMNKESGEMDYFEAYRPTSSASAGSRVMSHSEKKDPRHMGRWRYTESHVSGDFSMASDTHLVLEANGTYRYWSGGMAGGGSAGSFSSGSSGYVDSGAWKTANKIVYIMEAGDTQWQPYARYYVDHDSMMLKFNNGSKQLWYRR